MPTIIICNGCGQAINKPLGEVWILWIPQKEGVYLHGLGCLELWSSAPEVKKNAK